MPPRLINLTHAHYIETNGYDVIVFFPGDHYVTVASTSVQDRDRVLAAVRVALGDRGDGWIEVN
jgi:hypothetical protein